MCDDCVFCETKCFLLTSEDLCRPYLCWKCGKCAEHYGFVLDNNPFDTVLVPLDSLPPSWKIIPDIQLLKPKHCFLHYNGIPSWALMKAVRLGCLSSAERKRFSFHATNGKICSVSGERKVNLASLIVSETMMCSCTGMKGSIVMPLQLHSRPSSSRLKANTLVPSLTSVEKLAPPYACELCLHVRYKAEILS